MVLNEDRGTAPIHIIGVSIPRSGHNFAVRLLQDIFPQDLFYCEYYGEAGCCQAVPCARRGTQPISFQKNHDFDLMLPGNIPDVFYLVMYRSPVPAILSARELYAEDFGDGVASDRDEYAVWLGRNAEYFVTFCERWLQRSMPNKMLVDYDELSGQTAAVLRRLLAFLGLKVKDRAIEEAIARTAPRGGFSGEKPYVPRSIEKSRYFDRELVARFESIVLDHFPRLAPGRALEPIDYFGTLTWLVFSALRARRKGDLEGALQQLDGAIEVEPENALLHFERAQVLLPANRLQEAKVALQRAADLFPTHRPILDALVKVSLAAGDVTAAVNSSEALDNLSEATLAGRLHRALLRVYNGEKSAGDDALAEVERERPDDAAVWRSAGEIWRARGDLGRALAAVETAVRLAPLHGVLYYDRAELLHALGRPHEAVAALREALAIDPGQPFWWQKLIEVLLAAEDHDGARAVIDEARGHVPYDANFQAVLDAALLQAGGPGTAGHQAHRRRHVVFGRAISRDPTSGERVARVRTSMRGRPGRRRRPGSQRGQVARLETQLSQVRAALGAAERRLHESAVTKQQQLETLSTSLHQLDDAFKKQNQELREAWGHAHRGWDQAHLLDEALQNHIRRLRAMVGWSQVLETARATLRSMVDQVPADLDAACAGAGSIDEARQRFLATYTRKLEGLAAVVTEGEPLRAALEEMERRSRPESATPAE